MLYHHEYDVVDHMIYMANQEVKIKTNGSNGINNMNDNANTTEIALSKPATTLTINNYQRPLRSHTSRSATPRSRSRSRSRHKRHDYLNNIGDKQPEITKIKQPNHGNIRTTLLIATSRSVADARSLVKIVATMMKKQKMTTMIKMGKKLKDITELDFQDH